MTTDRPSGARQIPEPRGIRGARTLDASWYSDPGHHAREVAAVHRRSWSCVALTDEIARPGTFLTVTVAGLPVLLVRDGDGELRGFLNVCRHRGAPLCHGSGEAKALTCPYHGWLYGLDGALRRARDVGEPAGFELAGFGLHPVAVAVWRRLVFVNPDPGAAQLDLGPLADAVAAFPIEDMAVIGGESHERPFNWKVLLENYSENYHTPFVHPEIDVPSEDYPMVSEGPVLYAWDRPLVPDGSPRSEAMARLLPGEPGWDAAADGTTGRPYEAGSYLTIWPNLMVNLFADCAQVMWVDPIDARTTRVERRFLLARSGLARPARAATGPAAETEVEPNVEPGVDVEAMMTAVHLVHAQDVAICTAVQRSHDAGVSAHGVLSTLHEQGVHFLHRHLRQALGEPVLEG